MKEKNIKDENKNNEFLFNLFSSSTTKKIR